MNDKMVLFQNSMHFICIPVFITAWFISVFKVSDQQDMYLVIMPIVFQNQPTSLLQNQPTSLQYSWLTDEHQLEFDWVLYNHHWEFPIHKKIIPMLTKSHMLYSLSSVTLILANPCHVISFGMHEISADDSRISSAVMAVHSLPASSLPAPNNNNNTYNGVNQTTTNGVDQIRSISAVWSF